MYKNLVMKKQILLVDDEPQNIKVLEFLLRERDYVFDRAFDGNECIDKIRNREYDVILLDLVMAKMSGWDALDILVDEVPQIPVIIVSALSRSRVAKGLLNKGAFWYLEKPVDISEVNLAVQNALAERVRRQSY